MTLEQQKELLVKYNFTGTVVEFYNKAVEAYELTETPIMTDTDFDILKAFLIESGMIEFKAGADQIEGDKKPLFYPMLSIQSVHQKDLDNQGDVQDFLDKKYEGIEDWYNLSWKYDGIALQAEYEPVEPYAEYAEIKHVLTRGERTHGVDVTEAVRHAFPSKVDVSIKAIIGEGLLSKANFEEHFTQYKNERNTASALIRKGDPETCKYIDVQVLKLVETDGTIICPELHRDLILEYDSDKCLFAEQVMTYWGELHTTLMEFQADRASQPYRTDGVIIRNDFMDLNEHKSGLYTAYTAYKFHAEQAVTEIIGIDFRLKNNGDLFPRGILKPVELDGSTVQHCSMYNYAYLLNEGVFPGAKVIVVKSGDIIPKIEIVLERQEETPEFRELHGIDECTYDGVNMKSPADVSEKRFLSGLTVLKLKDVGDAMGKKLFEAGYTKVPDLFKFDPEVFKTFFNNPGKQVQNAIDQVQKAMSNIKLEDVMRSLSFPGIGNTSSKKLAELIIESSFNDLEEINKFTSRVLNTVTVDESFVDVLVFKINDNTKTNAWEKTFLASETFVEFLNYVVQNFNSIDFTIEEKPVITEDTIKIMLTGSPKEFGFKTKDVFLKDLESKGIDFVEVKTINDCDILIADNVDGSSSKLKQARAKGKQIKTYGDF